MSSKVPILRTIARKIILASEGAKAKFTFEEAQIGSQRGRLKRSARAVQLFGRLAVLETHALR